MIPSGLIETIERTMFIAERTRGAGIADVRDIGASVRGTVAAGSVDYQLGLFNEMGACIRPEWRPGSQPHRAARPPRFWGTDR